MQFKCSIGFIMPQFTDPLMITQCCFGMKCGWNYGLCNALPTIIRNAVSLDCLKKLVKNLICVLDFFYFSLFTNLLFYWLLQCDFWLVTGIEVSFTLVCFRFNMRKFSYS